MYKGKPIKITDFSMETLKTRRAWSAVFQAMDEISSRIVYLAKLSLKTEQ
jgi:hypothetical protein